MLLYPRFTLAVAWDEQQSATAMGTAAAAAVAETTVSSHTANTANTVHTANSAHSSPTTVASATAVASTNGAAASAADLAAAKAAHRAAKAKNKEGAVTGSSQSTTVPTKAVPSFKVVKVSFAPDEVLATASTSTAASTVTSNAAGAADTAGAAGAGAANAVAVSAISVPYEQVTLSNGEKLLRYSVDAAHTVGTLQRLATAITQGKVATKATPDMVVVAVTKQRPLVRAPFYAQRATPQTQISYAQSGVITEEMAYVSLRESAANLVHLENQRDYADQVLNSDEVATFYDDEIKLKRQAMSVTPEMVRAEMAAGAAVIPANHNHLECEPMIIGKKFLTKVNANIGASAISSNLDEEIGKLQMSLAYGADTVMDLSTGLPSLMELRSAILRASPVPLGTVPVYEALDRVGGEAGALNWDVFKQVIIDQAEQGVDYFTIHAGLTQDLLPYAAKRLMGIVSRGGGIMASCMMQRNEENMAYANFDELMDICRRYDVALSLGDGLRPGALYDACDQAQYGELATLGKLALRCREHGVQCFIEGPGHVPLHRVKENQELEEKYCQGAPFYTLGPLVTDVGAGFDHITSAIGGTTIGMYGTSMLCYVTPSEHLALPTPEDVKRGLITYKIAAHAADLAKGLTQAYNLDHAMSRARATFRWYDQFALSFDMQNAYEVWRSQMSEEDCAHEVSFCSMCGPRFCPIRLNNRLQQKYKQA